MDRSLPPEVTRISPQFWSSCASSKRTSTTAKSFLIMVTANYFIDSIQIFRFSGSHHRYRSSRGWRLAVLNISACVKRSSSLSLEKIKGFDRSLHSADHTELEGASTWRSYAGWWRSPQRGTISDSGRS